MNDQKDSELLRAYVERQSEAAFATLVQRHLNFVYSAALRMVCDSHLAEDVTQGVFIALANNATRLVDRPVLSGWLHRTAQNIAAQTVRSDVRRRAREQEAAGMNELVATQSDAIWEHIAPHLDAALGELGEQDRDALLLRYFERKSAREMAQTLGVSDDAAQKRVSRAVERLREFFIKRGISVGTGGLVVVLSTNAVQAAPAGLALTISTAAVIAKTAIISTATTTANQAIAMTLFQKALITVTLAAAIGTGIYEASKASQLRRQVQTTEEQNDAAIEQIEQLERERSGFARRLASSQQEADRLRGDVADVYKLRAEVAKLRSDSQELAQIKSAAAQKGNDPAELAAKALLGKINLLKARMEQMPERKIPELQYLNDETWARIAQTARLETDAGIRQALSSLRDFAKQNVAPKIGRALQNYTQANNGQLPADVSQLKSYFDAPMDDPTLQRYQMLKTGNVSDLQPNDMIVAEKSAVDDEYDSLFQIGLNSRQSRGVGKNSGTRSGGSWASATPKVQDTGK